MKFQGNQGEVIDINIPKLPKGAVTGIIALVLVIILLIWFVFQGPVYIVGPDEQGVIQTFGKVSSIQGPGLHFKWPWPIQTVTKPRVTEVKRLEIGFRTINPGTSGSAAQYRPITSESKMLTGDENIIMCELIVQYLIDDPAKYLFNVRDPDGTLHDLAEAVLRQVVGDRIVDDALTTGKTEIQVEIMESLQQLADLYDMGLRIQAVQLQDVHPPTGEVDKAFKDVATAREEKQQIINLSLGYQNEQIPRARGEAAEMVAQARGYQEARIAEAEGDVARFLAIATEYEKAPKVTEERLYLETMAKILPNMDKVIIDSDTSLLNINDLSKMGIQAP